MMRQTSLILSILIFTFLKVWPQSQQLTQVKGSVLDRESKTGLFNAAVVLLYDRNATMAGSTSTKQSGSFLLDSLQPGKYTLRISYLGYQTITASITILKHGSVVNQDSILMQKTGIMLQTLEVLGAAPSISIKKDTLEFYANNFKTRKNAVMEELLQRLPGLQIEKDGTIKVNGETIKRILVNGRLFLGTETTLATKNLPAEMIEKIQVIDLNPNYANFKGKTNTEKEKVINITVKKSWMDQLFGQASAAVGTSDRYAWNGNFNRFKANEQLSIISIGHDMNSTDFLTTGSQDIMLEGITSNWYNAINYSKDIGKKIKLGTSYHLNSRRIQNRQSRVRENLLQDSSYFYHQNSNAEHHGSGYTLSTNLEYKPDTLQRVILDLNLYQPHSTILQKSTYETVGSKEQPLNNGSVNNTSISDHTNLSGAITFEKKFKQKDRMLRTVLNLNYTDIIENGFNKSQNIFVLENGSISWDSIDQRHATHTSNKMAQISSNYTEPIFKDHFLDIAYAFAAGHNISEKSTYNYDKSAGDYNQLEDKLSNSFKNSFILHSAAVVLRAQKTKYDYGMGLNMISNSMTNKDLSNPEKLGQKITAFFPTIYLNYTLTKNSRFNIGYVGQPQLPDIVYLRPVPDNSNPMYIQKGNPDLRMSIAHNFNMSYTKINSITQRYLITSLFVSLIRNKIIIANNIDSLGKQTSYPINVNGAYSVSGQITNFFPFKGQKISINTTTTLGAGKNIYYTNNIMEDIHNYIIAQDLKVSFINQNKFDVNFTASLNYNNVRYSIRNNSNEEYFNYKACLRYNVNFPLGITLVTNLGYMLQIAQSVPYDPDVLILNAAISKSLFPNKQAAIKLHVLDLLNQNTYTNRYIGENYIEDINNQMLQRTILFSFSYYLKSKKVK